MKNAFHSYDIRGIYGKDFNKEDAYKIGFFLPELLNTKKILVGRDVRTSSEEIFEALASGITDAGADVYEIGLSTTPMVYWLTAKYGFDASVQITASHNPKEYNGMKISRTNALPVGFDTGLNKLLEMATTQEPKPTDTKGKIIKFDKRNEYVEFLKKYLPDLSDLTISIDGSNGMAYLILEKLLFEYNDKINYIFEKPDGTFPNHDPNPLKIENVKWLSDLVNNTKSDIGIIFDGDADRVMFTDEKGNFIPPDLMIAVMGHYFMKKSNSGKVRVLQDIRTSKSVGEYLTKHWQNIEMHIWKVGRAHAALKLREIDGLWGGELAGHYYFKDFYYSDSGILASLIILQIVKELKEQGKTIGELINEISKYYNSGEINFKIEHKKEAIEAVVNHFIQKEKPEKVYDFDGYRLEYSDWWFNIRPSNTEPYLRLLIEAKSEGLLKEKTDEIKSIIAQYD
jgi:phosphomannomutase